MAAEVHPGRRLKLDRQSFDRSPMAADRIDPVRNRGSVVALLILMCAGLTACGSISNTSGPRLSTRALVALAERNAIAAGWVHEVVGTRASGHSLSMINDIGTSEGRQVIDSDGGHSIVIVMNGMAYIQGDARAVTTYFGIPASDPQALAGRWISIRPSDQNFSAVSASVTLASDFHNLMLGGPFTEGPAVTLDGRSVTPVSGHVQEPGTNLTVSATLFVTTTGRILPVSLRASGLQGSENVRWSGWGAPVSLAAPSDTVPISAIPTGLPATSTLQ